MWECCIIWLCRSQLVTSPAAGVVCGAGFLSGPGTIHEKLAVDWRSGGVCTAGGWCRRRPQSFIARPVRRTTPPVLYCCHGNVDDFSHPSFLMWWWEWLPCYMLVMSWWGRPQSLLTHGMVVMTTQIIHYSLVSMDDLSHSLLTRWYLGRLCWLITQVVVVVRATTSRYWPAGGGSPTSPSSVTW